MKGARTYDGLEIAVIGMSGQFPQSEDYRIFWANLAAGKELAAELSPDEIRKSGVTDDMIADPQYVKSAAPLTGKEYFDHAFFGYRPDEAALMDPHMRLFHIHCWKALEDAGYAASPEKQKIGLFAVASETDNWRAYAYQKAKELSVTPYYLQYLANNKFIGSMLAYKFNFRGPVMYIDSACSSSLVAIHTACRSLLTRECALAISGGVSLSTYLQKGYYSREGFIFSPDGHTRSFDKQAAGTYAGEGIGVVVLKRLNEAIKDRDHIYAIIKSSAINNDGNDKMGFTAPSIKGQAECIRMAHKSGGVDPGSIGYVEAHGTGTKLGDPIEIKALNTAFAVGGSEKFCALGTVKTNMGHLDTAAGVAALIKVSLCLTHKKIPPTLHFNEANPEIDFDGGPFFVNTTLKNWRPIGDFPLRAGVSSFGIGGTNAHIVMEEAPEQGPADAGTRYQLLLLSAKSQKSLKRYITLLSEFIRNDPSINLADMAYTLQVGRAHYSARKPVVYKDREDLLTRLSREEDIKPTAPNKEINVVFMFPGQGSQYPFMGKDLYEHEPVFRKEMDNGFSFLKQLTGKDYREILYPALSSSGAMNRTLNAQPLIFLFEYSLARLLMNWGIKPKYFIGHSIGEYVAACLCGLLSYENALKLVVRRAELMDQMPAGAMIIVAIGEEKARSYLHGELSIAAINGPEQIVFSGPASSIDELLLRLKADGITGMKLNTSHAFHSAMFDPILERYRKELEQVEFSSSQGGGYMVSNLTGEIIKGSEAASPEYWVKHLRQPVNFSAGMKTLLAQNGEMQFVEVGAGRALINLIKQRPDDTGKAKGLSLVRHQHERGSDEEYLLERLGQLWTSGVEIDWTAFNAGHTYKRIPLPTYSFEQIRYPAEVDPAGTKPARDAAAMVKERKLSDWIYYPVWKSSFLLSSPAREQKKCFLVFSPEGPLAVSLRAALAGNNDTVIELFAGNRFQKRTPHSFSLNPADSDHFNELFQDLKNAGPVVTDIVYAWCIGMDRTKMERTADNRQFHLAYFSIVETIRGLFRHGIPLKNGVTILTDSLHRVSGNEVGSPAQSLALGLLPVLPQEYPVSCRNIDIVATDDPEAIAGSVSSEIRNGDFRDRIVAIRNGRRWVQDYEKVFSGFVMPKGNTKIKRGGVYLITGGLGNVGFLLAKYLVSRYDAKVVLTGRKKISGPSADDEPARRLRHLKEMTKDVAYINSDVGNVAELLTLARTIENDFGRINGIIHAAGNLDRNCFELIEDITPQHSAALFLPKVQGIENLYHVFKDYRPDFVWITSSIASIVGGLRFGAYSSANAYMESFLGMKFPELPNWKCVGLAEIMPLGTEGREDYPTGDYLDPGELTDLFELSLHIDLPVIFETVKDLSARMEDIFVRTKDDDRFNVENVAKSERPKLANSFVAPFSQTETILVALLENFFGIGGIGVNDNFFDLGGDSLMAMTFLTRVRNTFNIHITIKFFFDNPTVQGLSVKIDEIKSLKEVKKQHSKKII